MYGKGVSELELSPDQINRIPKVVEADLLRALQTLPGITAVSDFSSALYVRGGTPDQNLYLIDGVDVYNPEHAFGIFSTFNTAAIKKVEVSKGGFGAEYGGRLSSVLNVTNLDGNRNRTEGVVNISLLSASTTLQMPLGEMGSLSGSFRRTYLDQTVSKWVNEVPAYYFYDGNLKAYLDLGENDKLTLSFFTGKDTLDYKLDKEANESFAFIYRWGNTTGSLNWKHLFGSNIFMNFWVTGSRFFSKMDIQQLGVDEQNYLNDYTVKSSFEWYLNENINLKFGGEHKFLSADYDQEWDQGKINLNQDRQLTSGFASMIWNPSVLWQLEAGFRYNHFTSDETYNDIEPRFSLKYRLDESSSLKFATGRYYQYLNRVPRSFLSSIWSTADKFNKPSMSDHLILGYHKLLGQEIELRLKFITKLTKICSC
ncbi:MAG: TonB-dependent receptor plug domain-containing protein [Ignavibacteriales bacterium]|nr:TonB-dependent receptor plug domain-containing protein [Ignavibacteriales bacterium]